MRALGLLLAATVALAPKWCASGAEASREAPLAPAPPPPPSATTPPVWSPPEPASANAAATAPGGAEPPPSPELVKARAAADGKDWKRVRALLEKRARGGRGTPEEAQLVVAACAQAKDRACVDAVKARYPDLVE